MNGSSTTKKLTAIDLAYIALFTALITICSWISVPMTIPFTMQTFAVFVAVGLLGTKRGTLSLLVYILLGMIGVPVFAGFHSGIGVLMGNTGGYIIGFILSTLIAGISIEKFGKKTWVMALAMVSGLIVCYIFGTVWFMYLYAKTSGAVGVMTALGWCVLPYVIPDLVKICLAIIIVKRVGPYVKA